MSVSNCYSSFFLVRIFLKASSSPMIISEFIAKPHHYCFKLLLYLIGDRLSYRSRALFSLILKILFCIILIITEFFFFWFLFALKFSHCSHIVSMLFLAFLNITASLSVQASFFYDQEIVQISVTYRRLNNNSSLFFVSYDIFLPQYIA